MAHAQVIQVGEGFWNIRGSFKVGGLVDVGTHCSLVRLSSGNFVFLDSYDLGRTGNTETTPVKTELDRIIGPDATVEAIINLHPFHTVHVERMHATYPEAKLYGTARHLTKLPNLPWQAERSEDHAMHTLFQKDFAFSVPNGVELISANENVHFSSVLAYHRASRTIHVDDTFMLIDLPRPLGLCGLHNYVGLHPTLGQALEKQAGASADFTRWLKDLAQQWHEAENLCAAHSATLTPQNNRGDDIAERLVKTLRYARWTLARHQKKYG